MTVDLRDACSVWQSGRDGGSSRLRGAARVLTGEKHYFDAPYITEHETAAAGDPGTLERARVLLAAVADSDPRSADAWCREVGLAPSAFAGRGKKSEDVDDQIRASLATGQVVMPLWGVSLSRAVADDYGTRFVFEIEGPFHAVAAWRASGEQAELEELITGGRYEVRAIEDEPDGTRVLLREIGPVRPHA